MIPFYLKVLFGICYGIYFSNDQNADTWMYFNRGVAILDLLRKDGLDAFASLLSHKVHDFSFISGSSYFEYYRYAIMDWISAFLSFLSGKNYYINIVIYNYFIYICLIKLYRFLLLYKAGYGSIFYFILFCFPPFIFWTSGFHRDGLCISFLGIGLYYLYLFFESKHIKYLIFFIICSCFLIFFRSFWGISFVAMASLWWWSRKRGHSLQTVMLGLLIFSGIFFTSSLLPKSMNLPLNLTMKQAGFKKLIGQSKMPLNTINGSPISYIYPVIQAVDHLIFRPHPNEIHNSFLYLLIFIENIFIWSMTIFIIILWRKKSAVNPFMNTENSILFGLVLINYLVIGITVPFLGAIVRYKAPFEMFLLIILVQFIPVDIWSKFIFHEAWNPDKFVTTFQKRHRNFE